MKLHEIRVRGFRCLSDVSLDGIPDLMVLVGENDAGKTSIMNAVSFAFGQYQPNASDFSRFDDDDGPAEIVTTATLVLEGSKVRVDPAFTVGGDGKRLKVRRRYVRLGRDHVDKFEIDGMGFVDGRVGEFEYLKAPEQKELLSSLGTTPAANKHARLVQLEKLIQQGHVPRKPCWIPMRAQDLHAMIPIDVVRIDSTAFADPEQKIASLLTKRVASAVSQYCLDNSEVFSGAEEVARQAISEEVSLVEREMKKFLPSLRSLQVRPDVDFTKPRIQVTAKAHDGSRLQPLHAFGAGTRRRFWFAIEHHEAGTRESEEEHGLVIRLYDEPDSQLHYEAQRRLFRTIRSSTEADEISQSIVCTHAVTLIDRCTPREICLVRRDGPAQPTQVERIGGRLDSSTLDAFERIGRRVGLNNLALLYERCFLAFEGDSEQLAIPLMYKCHYGTEIEDDGIRLVNLRTCGAWDSVLSVLSATREGLTHLLLDADCTAPESTAKVTPAALAKLGLDPEQDVSLVGEKEFEDAFSDAVWVRALNKAYPRADGRRWVERDVSALRPQEKFSESLRRLVFGEVEKTRRSDVSKPRLAEEVALALTSDEVPAVVLEAFERVRAIAGLA